MAELDNQGKRKRVTGRTEAGSEPGKEGQDLLQSSENVDDLRRMFDGWARAYKKVYSSVEEREERFKIFLENKKFVDEHNSRSRTDVLGLTQFGDKRACEIKCGLCTIRYTAPQYVGKRQDFTGMNIEELKEVITAQVSMSYSEVRSIFDSWAEGHNKVYSSDEEGEERFKIFVSTKMYLDEQNSHIMQMSEGEEPYFLNEFSDRKDHEMPFGFSIGGYNPPKNLQMAQDAVMNNEELKEKWNEFERWATAHNKAYACEEERRFRFLLFLDNKSKSEVLDKWDRSLGDFWTYEGFDFSVMDLMGMET